MFGEQTFAQLRTGLKQHLKKKKKKKKKKKDERGTLSEFMSCVKVEVDVLGSPSLIVLVVSVDVKHHLRKRMKPGALSEFRSCVKVKVAVLVPNSPDGLCGLKATFEEEEDDDDDDEARNAAYQSSEAV